MQKVLSLEILLYEKRNNIKNGFYHLNQIAFAYNSILYWVTKNKLGFWINLNKMYSVLEKVMSGFGTKIDSYV